MRTELPDELERLLHQPALEKYAGAMRSSLRSCWRLEINRLGRVRAGAVGRLLGRKAPQPRLPRDCSKLGGLPHLESIEDWPRDQRGNKLPFVGQINFAELPPISDAAPGSGIFTLFSTHDEPFYRWKWYPAPGDPVDDDGPSLGKWEARITGTPAVSVSFDSWWNAQELEGTFDDLVEWDAAHGGTLGAWTVATIDAHGPRAWCGAQRAPGEKWIQVWDQHFEEMFGSLVFSVVVRADDFEAGNLDRCAVIAWQ